MVQLPGRTLYRTQTTNYGPHLAIVSDTNTINGNTTTTHSGTQYDANGYPTISSMTTKAADGVTTTSTGFMLYEFEPQCSK